MANAEIALMEAQLGLVRFEGDEALIREHELHLVRHRLHFAQERLQSVLSLHGAGRATSIDVAEAEIAVMEAELALRRVSAELDATE